MNQRLKQFWSALTAHVAAHEIMLVKRALPPAEFALFARMPRYDQRHCLDVYYALADAGVRDDIILRGALYHDTGKVDPQGRPVPLLWYGGLVIFKKLFPTLYGRLAASPRGLRHYFYYYEHHDRLGAELAAQADAPAEIVAMLRCYHDDDPADPRARVLKSIDELY